MKRHIGALFALAVVAVVTGLFFLRSEPALGANLTVSTTADTINTADNLCSLREAMNVARTNSLATVPDDCGGTPGHATDPDTITLQTGAIYSLVDGDTDDTGDLDGGGGPLVLQKAAGAGTATIDPNDNDRALETHSSVTTVTDITFVDGSHATECGGAIRADANLTLTRVVVNGNNSNQFGGGVCVNSAALTMSDSEVFSNTTSNPTPALGQGGGIRLIGDGITHTITGSLVFNNIATGNGADIVLIGINPTLNITNSTIRTFSAGTTSSISAQGGTTINLLNVTGVTNSDNAVLLHNGGGAINARNSIFDKQMNANVCVDGNTLNSLGHNIEDGTSCGLDGPNDKPNQNPLLNALALNGGITRNFSLMANSPAVDAADNGNCPATDQRAVNRPIGNGCDIGSFESAFVSTPTPSPTPVLTETPDPTNGSTPPPPQTATPSVTPSPTGLTPTASGATASPSPTPTATPTPTSTDTGGPTPTGTAAPTPTPTTTPEPTPLPSGVTAAPTPTPTPAVTGTPGAKLLQGDVQCDNDVDSVDALQQLRDVASLQTFQEDNCPTIGSAGAVFGDVDCDGDVDSVDALKVLRHVAALSVTQTEPCTDIGDPL